MPAKLPLHRGPDFRIPGTYLTTNPKSWSEYVAAERWRCQQDGSAHHSVYDEARKAFVCKKCGQERPVILALEKRT